MRNDNNNLNWFLSYHANKEDWRYTKTDRRAYYSELKGHGLLSGTIKEAMAKWMARQANQPPVEQPTMIRRLQDRRCTIPLGFDVSDSYSELAWKEFPQRKNWIPARATSSRIPKGWLVEDHNRGRYSSGCTYTRYEYEPLVTSYGFVGKDRQLFVRIGTESKRIKAPKGYYWDRNGYGIRLVANRDSRIDYHPTASELLADSPLAIAATLRDYHKRHLAEIRKQREEKREKKLTEKRARQAVKQAEKEGAQVGLLDSVRTGNCRVGSESWCRRHKLDPTKHYAPSVVLSQANGDARQVALVVNHAIRRHRVEMERGHCLIADHLSYPFHIDSLLPDTSGAIGSLQNMLDTE